MVSSVVNYFNQGDSDIFLAGLDISKAFDSVNHYGLYTKLMEAHALVCILNVIINWYSKFNGRVNWKGVLLEGFAIKRRVVEGSILSLLLFILYANDLIKCSREEGVGCYIDVNYCGYLLFLDDIQLILASVLQLQCMLIICYEFCKA